MRLPCPFSFRSFLSPDNLSMGFLLLHQSPWQLCPTSNSEWTLCSFSLVPSLPINGGTEQQLFLLGSSELWEHWTPTLPCPMCSQDLAVLGYGAGVLPAGTAVPPRVSQLCSDPCPGMWWLNCPLGWFCSRGRCFWGVCLNVMPTGRWECFSTARVCILEQSAAAAPSPAQQAENLCQEGLMVIARAQCNLINVTNPSVWERDRQAGSLISPVWLALALSLDLMKCILNF